MGRKRKFGEESDFVSVRVPKSKRREYRNAIRHFVEEKFTNESVIHNEVSKDKLNRRELDGFRKFEEFIKDLKNMKKERDDE